MKLFFILVIIFFQFNFPSYANSGPYATNEIGGRFTLTDHNGNLFDLQDARGKLVLILIFFGYTSCPDVCPMELSTLASLLKRLGDDQSKVKTLFISIDPETDTPEVLKRYVSFFSTDLLGLTGSRNAINSVTSMFQAGTAVSSTDRNVAKHSANLYMLGGDGKLLRIIPFGLPLEHIHKMIQIELKNPVT